ncbi:MAG: patatin-like phospholipase family protein, partial [Gemmatimonadaceae bacterium]
TMKRALVLGGGGNVGIAWEMGVLAGLAAGGIDVRDADLIVGTSAGSVVGTQIASGREPQALLEERRTAPQRPLGSGGPPAPDIAAVFTTWLGFDEITQDAAAAVGALALRAQTMPEEQWLAGFEANGWDGWPEKPLLVTAVECESGKFRAFDRDSGVPIERAVASSCAVPGLFPPVDIDGVRCMDGGVWSGTSADLAQRIEPDIVLIVPPLGWGERGLHLLSAKQLAGEMAALELAGVRVRVIAPDAAARAQMVNLMDPATALPAADAGEAHARALARELRAWWG